MRVRFLVLGFAILSVTGCGCPTPRPFSGWSSAAVTRLQDADLHSEEKVTTTIDARVLWADTGVVLARGDEFQVSSTGTWSCGLGYFTGPEGGPFPWWWIKTEEFAADDVVFSSLIGRIGNRKPFPVGRGGHFQCTTDGQLLMMINDGPNGVADNSGAMTVEIQIRRQGSPPTVAQPDITCDVRVVRVSDGRIVAQAEGKSRIGELQALARQCAGRIEDQILVRGESLAVVTFRNRTGTDAGRAVADELADKLAGALTATQWFDVKERIDLRAVLDEKDLETSDIVRNPRVQGKLGNVKYIIIGGVTMNATD